MTKTAIAAIVAMLLLGGNCRSSEMAGTGTVSCSEFAEQYRVNPADAEIFYFSWAQGFMSASNIAYRVMHWQPN